MFTSTDYDKLQQIMDESPEKKELLTRLLESHQMDISTISHEIRNPLTLVYSTFQLIQSQHPEVTTYKHWASMGQDIEYMNQLLSELSAYNNGERLNPSPVDAGIFLKRTALSFAASIVDTDIEFTSDIASDLPVIQMDSVKLRQLLGNLLANAKDGVSEVDSSHHPAIFLESFTKHQSLILRVRDNGCGIPEDKLKHIFEPFVTYKKNGTGLGLAISHRVAKAHGGNLTASSVPGSSTTFTLSLPI